MPGLLVADALDALTDAAVRAVLPPMTLARGARPNGAVAAWLGALTGPRRGFTAEAAALRTLRSELDQWQRDAAGGTVRASFRLVEPSADELTEPVTVVPADPGAVVATTGPWRIEFGLRATDEPGLHVDAGQVWRGGGVTVAGDHPQEILLAELGRASGCGRNWTRRCAPPDRKGWSWTPRGRTGSCARARRRCTPRASRCCCRPGGLRERARSAPGAVTGPDDRVGLDALVDYRWELALGDEPLTSDELTRLAELKTPLVRLRGRWVELDPKRSPPACACCGPPAS